MRNTRYFVAAAVAVAALSAQAQQPHPAGVGPFTYDALGATPSLAVGRKAVRAVEAQKPAEVRAQPAARAVPAAGAFTYDALGATPHVEKKPVRKRADAAGPADH